MTLNTALATRNLLRLLKGRPVALGEVAIQTYELCPAEEVPGRPALHPEGAIERISSLSPWRDWDVEYALIKGAPVCHAPTLAYVVENAVLAGSHVYCGGAKLRVGRGDPRLFDPDLPPRAEIPEAHLVATWTGADFFGNFMRDSLTLEMIPDAGMQRIGAHGKSYPHAPGYRALLGMPEPEMPGHALVGQLTLYSDFGQNTFKSERYHALRERLRRSLSLPPARPGVFLRRGTSGEFRCLVNEDALTAMLENEGFDILDQSLLDPSEIAARALDARIVVAVEGSHLAHAIYPMAANGAFLVIQPPDRFALPYKEFADRMEMRFGFVVAAPAEGGFVVDLDEVRLMLDRLA